MTDRHLSFRGFLGKRVHLGVCGSIAAFKALELMRQIIASGAGVSATLTNAASHFITPLSFSSLGADPVYENLFDPNQDVYAHLGPGHAAECMVIAPATANFIAKLANGLADDMLSCQALAFKGSLIVAPSMNPLLWNAQATKENWDRLKSRGLTLIEPECGEMACGDSGKGRFPATQVILAKTLQALSPQDLAGKKILISLGPTREYFDPARFWSNPSSGLMGACLAIAAWLRGADVHVVKGPCEWWFPEDIVQTKVTSAADMYEACVSLWPACDIGCMTAAVADFSPIPMDIHSKFKKDSSSEFKVEFTRTRDILKELGANKTNSQKLIGFCAETHNLQQNAESKLARKNCDLIIGNHIGVVDSGFSSNTNSAIAIDKSGRVESWPILPKTEVAWRIWDWMTL